MNSQLFPETHTHDSRLTIDDLRFTTAYCLFTIDKTNRLKKLLFLLALAASLTSKAQSSWEVDLLRSINPQNPSASTVWKTISATAKPISVAMPVGMFIVGLADKNKPLQYKAYEMAGGLLITAITTGALKAISDRPRPYYTYSDIYPDKLEDGSSFPSGHTSVAFSTATTLALQYKKWYISVPAFVWAGAVGYSRMYLGQHYPSDIAMGAVVGVGSEFASHWISKKLFYPSPKKKPVQP